MGSGDSRHAASIMPRPGRDNDRIPGVSSRRSPGRFSASEMRIPHTAPDEIPWRGGASQRESQAFDTVGGLSSLNELLAGGPQAGNFPTAQ